jgi:hypothetical protein
VEHFIDVEDQTSGEGGFMDSDEPDGSDNIQWQFAVLITPLSLENNIYKNDDLDVLAVRSIRVNMEVLRDLKTRAALLKINQAGTLEIG